MPDVTPFTPAASFASDPARSRGRLVAESDSPTRTVFQRDRDRIIHSGAFRKLQYKTQVFVYHEGDYYRTRLTHSIEVAQIARSIARVLGLNEDLAEGLALAHDLGHTCFGHAGEDALHACMADYGGFDHNDQALRIVTHLERRYADFDGLNLTWESLEGLVKHNGPALPLKPGGQLGQTTSAFNFRYDLELSSYASAEAQIAALSDDIAYNNHDLDDGLRANIITLDELRELPIVGPAIEAVTTRKGTGLERSRMIHDVIRSTINAMVIDVLEETGRRLETLKPDRVEDIRNASQPVVAFSESMEPAQLELRKFLFANLYRHHRVNRMTSKARRIVRDLFEIFMAEPQCLPPDWRTDEGRTEQARLIADYIAGMTDRYAMTEHGRLFDLRSPAL